MKKGNKFFITFFIILVISIIIGCIKINAETIGIVTEITVNVRKEASIDSDIIMYVTQDDKVEILSKTGDWYKINFKNTEGYIYSDYIKLQDEDKIANNEEQQKTIESENEEVTKTIEPKLLLQKDIGVRITPNISSSIIYTTSSNTNVELLEQINGWSYISINNICGWVRNDKLQESIQEENNEIKEKDTTKENKEEIAYVKYNDVNLRKEPSTDSGVIEKLKLNTQVTVIESVDTVWNKVKVNENIGYISKDLLANEKQNEQVDEEKTNTDTTSRDGQTVNRETVASQEEVKKEETYEEKTTTKKEENKTTTFVQTTKGEEIVNYAKKFLGYKYVYGGASPETGFDCSGFTSYVYAHFGYSISRSSVEQANCGTKVNKENLQPGDLVIYKNTSLTRIGHVGIYIGNNQMIHASEPGVGVIITDIDSKAHNYPKRYVMGRRII